MGCSSNNEVETNSPQKHPVRILNHQQEKEINIKGSTKSTLYNNQNHINNKNNVSNANNSSEINMGDQRLDLPEVIKGDSSPINTAKIWMLSKHDYEKMKADAAFAGKAIIFIFGQLENAMEDTLMHYLKNHADKICYITMHYNSCLNICIEDITRDKDFDLPVIKAYFNGNFIFSTIGPGANEVFNRKLGELVNTIITSRRDEINNMNKDNE